MKYLNNLYVFQPVFNSMRLYVLSHLNLKVATSPILRLQLVSFRRKMAGAKSVQIWLPTLLEWEVELVAPSRKENKNQQRHFHVSLYCHFRICFHD